MRWTVLSLCVLLAGCGAAAAGTEQGPTLRGPADPRTAKLGWSESYGEGGRVLRFEVVSLEVREDGWSARVALENRTGITWDLGNRPLSLVFGLMLLPDGRLETLDELNRAGALPPVREAEEIEPPPPDALAPGDRWEAALSARGSLPAGSWIRLSFGTLFARSDPPGELLPRVVWITDRAYPL